jgi:UDP-GlcNAc:undecaprenyl-phosphate/decaprenyl-phosphate GlcNAc-1-phosphate transferase
VGDLRIISLGGMFGFDVLSYVFSIALSVFAIVGIVNAFNLIDGIDGLAGSLGLIISVTFAFLFYCAGDTGWAFIAAALAGATAGFLIYNVSPARIFMGDSGSLMLGFFAAIMSIHLINISVKSPIDIGFTYITSAPALTAALLVIPVFDTLRVFTIRLIRNQSPFKADNNHLHHRLLSLGLNHLQATGILAGITIIFICFALYLQDIGNSQLIFTMALLITLINSFFSLYIYSSRKTQFPSEGYDSDTKGDLDGREHIMDSNKRFVKSVLEKITEN